jgi:prophage antirepressor-like protein
MNKMKVFENAEFGQVRTMVIDNEPWFVGKDIAEALGYKRPSDAIASHVYEGDKLKRCFTVSGQGRNLLVINESGMYALIFGSKLESSIRFKNWVTSEVPPSIRKHGGYFSGQEEMNDQELLARGYLVALRQIEARTKELEGLIPKGEFFDRFISLGDCTCLRDTAKELGVPQNRFINILLDEGYLVAELNGMEKRYFSRIQCHNKV